MKNYLVKSLNKIKTNYWGPDLGDREKREGDIYPFYKKMNDLSVASFKHFLKGDWEYIFLSTEVENVNENFRDQFFKIYDIWKSEPCNILYCGADTQMVQPTEVFGKYKHFLMFNYTDPKVCPPFQHFLNADIRYLPAEMPESLWDIGLKRAKEMSVWNDDQKMYNEMVWSQGLTPEQVIDPTMAFQGFMMPGNYDFAENWNGCKIEDIKMIHWHGSRDARSKLEAMQYISDILKIPEE